MLTFISLPCTRRACKLISNVPINEHLHHRGSTPDWTFPWADRRVELQLNSLMQITALQSNPLRSDWCVCVGGCVGGGGVHVSVWRHVCMRECSLSQCTQVCVSYVCVRVYPTERTQCSLKGTKSWPSHTPGNKLLSLCVCVCVCVCGHSAVPLPSISVIELGLEEIMILITHKLKGSWLFSATCCCFSSPLPSSFPSFSHFSVTWRWLLSTFTFSGLSVYRSPLFRYWK